jgi:hypothetical protein
MQLTGASVEDRGCQVAALFLVFLKGMFSTIRKGKKRPIDELIKLVIQCHIYWRYL